MQSSADVGATWTDAGEYDLERARRLRRDAEAEDAVPPRLRRRLRAPRRESAVVTVTPKVKLGKPQAPSAVKRGAKFTAYGSVAPKQTVGAKVVRIKCYLKQGGKWRYVKSVKAANKTATRYSARLSLPGKGSWKLVASYKATAMYAATTSGPST